MLVLASSSKTEAATAALPCSGPLNGDTSYFETHQVEYSLTAPRMRIAAQLHVPLPLQLLPHQIFIRSSLIFNLDSLQQFLH
jgi:hypothetical protein